MGEERWGRAAWGRKSIETRDAFFFTPPARCHPHALLPILRHRPFIHPISCLSPSTRVFRRQRGGCAERGVPGPFSPRFSHSNHPTLLVRVCLFFLLLYFSLSLFCFLFFLFFFSHFIKWKKQCFLPLFFFVVFFLLFLFRIMHSCKTVRFIFILQERYSKATLEAPVEGGKENKQIVQQPPPPPQPPSNPWT